MSDTRVVYGATCSWWDSIDKVGKTPTGLPACPHCGGVLYEIGSEREWWDGVRRHDADAEPGYIAFIEWLRGRCFPGRNGLVRARAAYAEQDQ